LVPLHDNNPTRTTPYVVLALIAANVVTFLHELSLSEEGLNRFFYTYAIVPEQLTASLQSGNLAYVVPQLSTLITSQFLHGGFLHVGGNMLFLWVFGNNIEDQIGHLKFLIFYLICGSLAGLAQWFFFSQSAVPVLGASGAIAGVLGAYILRFPRAEVLTLVPFFFFLFTIHIPAVLFLGFWFLQQAVQGVAALQASTGVNSGGVAYWAHAGGFVFGALLAAPFGLFRRR